MSNVKSSDIITILKQLLNGEVLTSTDRLASKSQSIFKNNQKAGRGSV